MPPVLSMMNALPDPVICFNPGLDIRYCNRAAQTFFQMSEKQLLAKDMVELLGDKNIIFESVEKTVRENQTVTLHDVGIREKPVSSVIIAMVEQDAWYLFLIHQQFSFLGDEWNEKTKYSGHDSRRTSQILAYEIRNPLASILSAVQLLEKSKLMSDEDRELTNRIARETLRLRLLMGKPRIFNDVQRNQYKPVNLHEILNRVAGMAQAEYGPDIRIEKNFDPSLPNIRGDFDTLVQAKMNMVKNAVEALPGKKGKISIRTFYDSAAGFNPHTQTKLPLCIEIEDNGKGIRPEEINRIFQPYFTTKAAGQGLGLSIASKIIDDHGGTIDVKSVQGKTVFKINLPVPTDGSKS
ncbi:MAG: ATP-binding protein [Pseudomonadota bacterium]